MGSSVRVVRNLAPYTAPSLARLCLLEILFEINPSLAMYCYRSSLFEAQCRAIYTQLAACRRFSLVWRISGAIPSQNGVGFCWQNRSFRIRWARDQWYLLEHQPLFSSPTYQGLIRFCLVYPPLSTN